MIAIMDTNKLLVACGDYQEALERLRAANERRAASFDAVVRADLEHNAATGAVTDAVKCVERAQQQLHLVASGGL